MLFHSSIRKELAHSFAATLLVLLTIVVTMMLIRTLSMATAGSVDPKEVMLVLGYTVLGRFHIILTMALFVAVVSVLSRMHRDSEMVIWMGSGRGLLGMVSPVLRFAWPVLLSMIALVLIAWPWTNKQTAELRDRFQQRSDLQRVEPGQFQVNATGNRVFFIDKETANGTTGRNVFVSSTEPRGESTVSAQAATISSVNRQQVLVLRKGQRLEATPDLQSVKVSEFDEYLAVIDQKLLALPDDGAMKTRSTLELIRTPTLPAQGELAWRAGLVLCAFNLLLVGLAVAAGNPRAGRSGNIAFATFAFLFYFNMLNIGETWVGHGKISTLAWMLSLHGSVFVFAVLWMLKRHETISLRAWVKQRLTRQVPAQTTVLTPILGQA